jgi:hypothetical protein
MSGAPHGFVATFGVLIEAVAVGTVEAAFSRVLHDRVAVIERPAALSVWRSRVVKTSVWVGDSV